MHSISIILVVMCGVGVFARSPFVDRNQILAEGPPCPIPDPLYSEEETPIEVALHPLFELLEGSLVSHLSAEGLSSLKYKYSIGLLPPSISFELELGGAHGDARYIADGYIDARPFREETIPSGNVTGRGVGRLSARKLQVKGKANIIVFGKLIITSVTADYARFESLHVDLGDEITIGGKHIDWDELSRNLKENFDRDFEGNKRDILNKLKDVGNSVLGQYTLQELLDLLKEMEEQECDT